jgi:ubiquitin C-terminal hydrolase
MTGLMNLGNTCFINAAIQCLVRIPELNQLLDTISNSKHLFLNEYNDLRKLMLQGHGNVHPQRFIQVIHYVAKEKKMNFTGQQDLPDFLLFMITALHDSLSFSATINFPSSDNIIEQKCQHMLKETYSKDFSPLIPMFYGVYISRVHTTLKPEPFFSWDLPIPEKATTLVDCMNEFTKIETVDWYNEETKIQGPVEKQISICKLPVLLFITLKRFNHLKKNTSMIQVPLVLVLQHNYELIWVGNHQGSLMGGHYTCCAKQQQWLYIDDNDITTISEDKVITRDAYCLLFRIKTV